MPDDERNMSVAAFALQPGVELPSPESLGRTVRQVFHHEFPSFGRNGEVPDRCVGLWGVSRFKRVGFGMEMHDAGPIYVSQSIESYH